MIIGVPKEVKTEEYRVALLPDGVTELVRAGHRVLVESGAGRGAGWSDDSFVQAGAEIVASPAELYAEAELIVKVKEPQTTEIPFLRPGQILFCFLHLAASRQLTEALLSRGVIAFAYETLSDAAGRLPLLAPMSDIAGRLGLLAAAHYLQKPSGGRGVLLGRVAGAMPARVLVIGGGIAGRSAAMSAAALGAQVVVVDTNPERLREIAELSPANVIPLYASRAQILEELPRADVAIGAVLIPGARAPTVIERDDLSRMKPGSVIVDLSIDQGGCVATSQPTTHRDPTFVVDGIIHYCVANIPSAVAATSTQALCHATLPWIVRLAEGPLEDALRRFPPLVSSLNIYKGQITHPAVAQSLGLPCRPWPI
ncbi:MAG: alanine dehydrogenase [Thermoguttaceae bacterium]|nr:alanine dehydrogenase [Thermoguttaceae bacterium]MDW8078373.1 alanine dehydrogenase [Thermoguttaceae bacterium]